MKNLKIGQKVFWNDPDGETSAILTVLTNGFEGMYDEDIEEHIHSVENGEDDDRIMLLGSDSGGETEAYPCELTEMIRVHFRKWRESGGIIAMFPDYSAFENLRTTMYSFEDGCHKSVDYHFVLSQTDSADKEEYSCLLEELTGIGYLNLWIVGNNRLSDLQKQVESTREAILKEMFNYVDATPDREVKSDTLYRTNDEDGDSCLVACYKVDDGTLKAVLDYDHSSENRHVPVRELNVEEQLDYMLSMLK